MPFTFPFAPGAYEYRPMRYRRNRTLMRGWDVYALQCALRGVGFRLDQDGIFGPETNKAVLNYQAATGLVVDGIAGIATQRALCVSICASAAWNHSLPRGLPYGHVEKESGFQLGNYTAPYEVGDAAGSRDMGAVQMNSRYWQPIVAFDPVNAIDLCAAKIETKWVQYDQQGVVSTLRALELACGSWNAPAWTDTLARGGTLTPTQSSWIEAYIDRVTTYLEGV